MATNASITRPFFGGAIQASLPPQFHDLASVREVPDNQECWHDIDTDALFVLECLEPPPEDIYEAAQKCWKDLCDINESTPHDTESLTFSLDPAIVRGLPDTATVGRGVGFQRVLMGRAVDVNGNPRVQEERIVRVELCLIRLSSVQTDLLLTLSTPCSQNPQEQLGDTTFQTILSTLEIRDWGLFVVAK